ncbi:hypothetical protein IWX76_000330 [Pedobacter sp. CAN_A7]
MLSKYELADMDIKRVDQAFLNDFDYYLRSNKDCENNYVVKNVKNLGKILRIGLENGWVEKDHFLGCKGKTKNVDRYYLNQEELEQIAGKEFLSDRLRQVRDVFVFCCFTGLAYVDVFKLKQEHIQKGNDGERWIFTNRQKTKPDLQSPYCQPLNTFHNYRRIPLESSRDIPYEKVILMEKLFDFQQGTLANQHPEIESLKSILIDI